MVGAARSHRELANPGSFEPRAERGEGGIRTRGGFHHTAFRERHLKPLGHLSSWAAEIVWLTQREPGLSGASWSAIRKGCALSKQALGPSGNHGRDLLPARLGHQLVSMTGKLPKLASVTLGDLGDAARRYGGVLLAHQAEQGNGE